jgi:DNA polymerase/3'-5' exonuclease PolX
VNYQAVAEEFVELVRRHCVRVEVAGSIRRGKPDPKDIEIVAVPRVERWERPRLGQIDLMTGLDQETVEEDQLDSFLTLLRANGQVKNRGAWGPRHKRLEWQSVPIDLFCVLPPASWGVIFALRTGPGDFNKLLVTSQGLRGVMPPDKRVAGGQLWHGGAAINTPDEDAFFAAIGVPCWPPEQRTLARLQEWRRMHLAPKRGAGVE